MLQKRNIPGPRFPDFAKNPAHGRNANLGLKITGPGQSLDLRLPAKPAIDTGNCHEIAENSTYCVRPDRLHHHDHLPVPGKPGR